MKMNSGLLLCLVFVALCFLAYLYFKRHKNRVLLTGFGDFTIKGVEIKDNSSWKLVQELIKEHPWIKVGAEWFKIEICFSALTVSYESVDQRSSSGFRLMRQDVSSVRTFLNMVMQNLVDHVFGPPCLVINCGAINGKWAKGTKCKLRMEEIARDGPYDEPDIDGKLPSQQTLGTGTLKTSLDLLTVRGHADEKGNVPANFIQQSNDAGRFLCEYVYNKSLEATQKQCENGLCSLVAGPAALFVHVPSDIDDMKQQVTALHDVVYACLFQLQEQSKEAIKLATKVDGNSTAARYAAVELRKCDFNAVDAEKRFIQNKASGKYV
jgi:pyrrolidone-carboxylate peptidase